MNLTASSPTSRSCLSGKEGEYSPCINLQASMEKLA